MNPIGATSEVKRLYIEIRQANFLMHFASADMTEHHREQLEVIVQRHHEPILSLEDRYVQAMWMAG